MSNQTEVLALLALQYCQEQGLWESAHALERESGVYFDMGYFADMIRRGKWDEAENYISGFTKIDDNSYSLKLYFELRKYKYLEALDSKDYGKARDILVKDLKFLSSENEELYKEMTHLMTLNDIRENKTLAISYNDTHTARKSAMTTIKEIIEKHPKFVGKLKFPKLPKLRDLLNEGSSRNYQNHASLAATNQGVTLNNFGVPNETSQGRPYILIDDESGSSRNIEITGELVEKLNKLPNSVIHIRTSSQCHMLSLPKLPEGTKIAKLTYVNNGSGIFALTSNAIHLLWLWTQPGIDSNGKATTQVCPILWHPTNDVQFMINDLTRAINGGDLVSSFDISKNGTYLVSTSGGMVSLFHMYTFKTLHRTMAPPPTVTCLAFYPQDNNILVAGFDDSTILLFNIHTDEVRIRLEGHSNRVTALAFSNNLNVLVSADSNAKIIAWNQHTWEKLRERNLQISGPNVPQISFETQIQFHPDQHKFLVVHNINLAIFDATQFKCVTQWDPNYPRAISQATFSCTGEMVYACFVDGSVATFDASNFQMHFKIHSSIYASSIPSSVKIFPTAITSHPRKPYQFAVGFTDGNVYVFEPKEPCTSWMVSQTQRKKYEGVKIEMKN